MEHVNVVGIPCRVPVQRRRARDIAFRAAVCREKPEHGALDFRQRHDRLAQSVLPVAGLCGCLQRARRVPLPAHPPWSVPQAHTCSRGRECRTLEGLPIKTCEVWLCWFRAHNAHTITPPQTGHDQSAQQSCKAAQDVVHTCGVESREALRFGERAPRMESHDAQEQKPSTEQ